MAVRLGQLDTVRAFAILLVLVEHWAGETIARAIPIGGGTLGVSCFFVLSGFLITSIFLKALDEPGATPASALVPFYIRRAFRLIPAFYAVLLVLVLLQIRGIEETWPWHASYLSNVYVALGGASNVFWTLAVEEQFYLVWPLILTVTPKRYRVHAAAGLILFGFALRLPFVLTGIVPEFRLTVFQLELLGAGCLLAVWCYRDGMPFQFGWITGTVARRMVIASLAAFAAATAVWAVWGVDAFTARFLLNTLLCAIGFAGLVVLAARGIGGRLGVVFDNPALQYIGRISYGLYLTHSFVPEILRQLLGIQSKLVLAPITVLLTFAVCALSWRFFESPLIAAGRKWSFRAEAAILRRRAQSALTSPS